MSARMCGRPARDGRSSAMPGSSCQKGSNVFRRPVEFGPPPPLYKRVHDAGPRLPSKSGKARYVLQERRRFVLCVVAPVLACGSVASARAHIASGLQQRTLHASFTRGLPAAIASSSRATRGAGAARPIEPQRSSLDGGFSAGVLGGIGERHLCRAWAGCGGDSRARQVAPRGGARE